MNKLQHAINRIEKVNNHKIKRVDIYGELYNYYVKFYVGFVLEDGQNVEITMMEMYGENLSSYDEIISFYDKFTSKCEKYIKDNYDFNVRNIKLVVE